MDWTLSREGVLPYSYERFAQAKLFVFRKWCAYALERHLQAPADLSGSCKYGSLFMNRIFGGSIRGHYEHQYNAIGGRIVDLSHDAADVGSMANPYLHEPEFFAIEELQISLEGCLPRVESWALEFLEELDIAQPTASHRG
ncbi:MAG: transcriptional regulator [Methylococcaceae bacterium]|nr:transcriptional regulator [Methylococcaceae bacterium]